MKTRKLLLTALSMMLVATSAFAFASCDQMKGAKGDKGETGATGATGAAGQDGLGVDGVEYDANGDLKITYTDGTSETIGMPGNEEHNYGDWTAYFVGDAYCGQGLFYRTCGDCNAVDWKLDQTHNWVTTIEESTCAVEGLETKTCECGATEEKVLPKGHNVNAEGVCGTCAKQIIGTEGLTYKVSRDGTYAYVYRYTGTAENVVIAEVYEELPVTEIGEYAFDAIDTNADLAGVVKTIWMPNSITKIGKNAFSGLTVLNQMTLSENLVMIDEWSFNYTTSLQTLNLPSTLKSIGKRAFSNAGLTGLTLPEGFESIGEQAFYNADAMVGTFVFPSTCLDIGYSVFQNASHITGIVFPEGIKNFNRFCFGMDDLETVNIPDSVEEMAERSFYKANLTNIYIGENLGSIAKDAFLSVTFGANLKIYYNGTERGWDDIIKEGQTEGDCYDTMKAAMFFYSKNEPTKEGNFWHYVEGVITEWPAYVAPETPAPEGV